MGANRARERWKLKMRRRKKHEERLQKKDEAKQGQPAAAKPQEGG